MWPTALYNFLVIKTKTCFRALYDLIGIDEMLWRQRIDQCHEEMLNNKQLLRVVTKPRPRSKSI
jgi:hypothetical protein